MIKRHELVSAIALSASITCQEANKHLGNLEKCIESIPDVMDLECETDDSYDNGVQHWRGGSRKKGGKIGYRRGK